ncbi:MAG TPA: transporter substrate-binding domain-containing protein [Kiritimatiellia bacterium]|nr:transporter substrate-binding domain-containing protein [Kiritimatiellia bacterium]HRZ12003.1 transporter substrate-binding domain-containing protein [Kiritimatiellia bacterium]HSA17191.1 transporter substrate-binding domain-containing protein [Kiritimatiellia bacterium]
MKHWRNGFFGLAVFGLAGCSTVSLHEPLRVGVTPDLPPIIAKADGRIVGLEADFARRLARELRRPVEWVELKWEDQVPALLTGRIDLIMSGMSVTEMRKVRIAFCEPYMTSGLMALTRREGAGKYRTREALLRADAKVGVKIGTTAELFAQEHFRNAQLLRYEIPHDAALALRNRTLDIYLDDAPAIFWLASKYESDLTFSRARLTEEDIAWGVSPKAAALKEQVNAILAGWREDGTLREILERWVPVAPKSFTRGAK